MLDDQRDLSDLDRAKMRHSRQAKELVGGPVAPRTRSRTRTHPYAMFRLTPASHAATVTLPAPVKDLEELCLEFSRNGHGPRNSQDFLLLTKKPAAAASVAGMFDALDGRVPESGGGVVPRRIGIARTRRQGLQQVSGLFAVCCAVLVSLSGCGVPGTKSASPSEVPSTATAPTPTPSTAPVQPPQSGPTQPMPSSEPGSIEPSPPAGSSARGSGGPPAPDTAPPLRHSGTVQGGKFCQLSEEGSIGFDATGDVYVCRDVDHDGHPHWVKPSVATSPSPAGTHDCAVLFRDGLTYEQMYKYWISLGSPQDMDDDHDGLPCETVYGQRNAPAPPAGTHDCQVLFNDGLSYEQMFDYWISLGSPQDMDDDHDGLPCETVYGNQN